MILFNIHDLIEIIVVLTCGNKLDAIVTCWKPMPLQYLVKYIHTHNRSWVFFPFTFLKFRGGKLSS